MARSRRRRSSKNKQSTRRAPKTGISRSPKMSGVLSDPRVAAWDRLLRDPCSGQLAYPCYTGTDTGYLVRTVDYIQPTTTGTFTVGADVLFDIQLYFSPYNLSGSTGLLTTSVIAGSAPPIVTTSGISNFITTGSTVRTYRPVACCVKWLPTGAYAKRAGLVGMAYTPGTQLVGGVAAPFISQALSLTQMKSSNGEMPHEVRWLPTNMDQNFTTLGASTDPGAGTVALVLASVDGTATSTTAAIVSGRVEITTVWEWTPLGSTSLSLAPRAPLPYSIQQVLGTITDLGAYLFHGARTGSGFGGMIRGVAENYLSGLTRGVRTRMSTGPQMPISYY